MTENLEDSILDKKKINEQIGTEDVDSFVVSRWKTETIALADINLLIESQDVSGGEAFILGDDTYGVLGTSTLGGDADLPAWVTVETLSTDQQVTNDMLQEVNEYVAGQSFTYPTHIGVGTGTTTFDVSQTALTTEVGARESEVTYEIGTSKRARYIFQRNTPDTSWNSNALREVALFSASSSGDMFIRRIITSLTPVATKRYKFTWDVTFNDA